MEVAEMHIQKPNGDVLAEDGASANRRKSGRVVKKPDAYSPDASQVTNGHSGKRKRVNGADVDEGAGTDASHESTAGSSGEDEEQSDDAHEEEVREKRRRITAAKKAQAGRPKADKPRASSAKTTSKGLAFRRKAARAGQNSALTGAEGLYDNVFFSGDSHEDVVSGWLSNYENTPIPAMRDMINFILRLTGCTLEVSTDDIEDHDNVTGKLSDLQDEYQAQKIVDYPLISKVKNSPPVRAAIASFFRALLNAMHSSNVLYSDMALLENIEMWITTMSSSSIRPLRHTATVIALEIVNSLCDLTIEIADADAKTMRQLETERKKSRGNKGRTTALEEKIGEGEKNRLALEGVIKDIFDTVFVHRYRDVDPRIRAECISALGYWILKLPDLFFDGSYLRYLGWVLSDTAGATRLEVVKQLQRLFKKTDNVTGLRSFIERFRSRLVEMATRDAESNVRVQTVELLDLIREAGMLEPSDIDTIGKLIFDSDLRLRKAVVGFFAQNVDDLYESKIEDLGGEDAINDAMARKGSEDFDKPRVAWLKLKCLVEVLQSYDTDGHDHPISVQHESTSSIDVLIAAGVESRFSLAAQALYDHIHEVKQWEILAGYLLFDHSEVASSSAKKRVDVETKLKRECKLDEKEEIILLKVLNSAVILSLAQLHDGDVTSKGKKKKVLKVGPLEEQEDLARHLSQLIPRLLKKFGAVPAAASTVLRLEHVLDLDVFHQLRQDSTAYSALLDDINKQFMTHGDQSVLVEASAALLHAKGFEDLEEVTGEKVQSLWEDTINTLQAILRGNKMGARGRANVDVLTSVTNTVRRLSNLASISDCTEIMEEVAASSAKKRKSERDNVAPIQLLSDILARNGSDAQAGKDQAPHELEDDLVRNTMKAILFYFMWKVRSLQENLSSGDQVAEDEIERLDELRSHFASQLGHIVQRRARTDDLRFAAIGTLLDLYTLFATLRQPRRPTIDATGETDPEVRISTLVSEISSEHQLLINSVFAAYEKTFAKKSRRTLEAGDDDEPMDSDSDDAGSEGNSDDEEPAKRLQAASLSSEQALCELTGKIVLAIIARVLDASGPHAGKTKARLDKNRSRLGPNYKEVVAYLDEPKSKKGKKKTPAASESREINKKSERMVAPDDEGDEQDDEIEDVSDPVEEGGDEDLRARELLEDDIDMEEATNGDHAADENTEEVDDEIIIGD
ncbi:MAG: hypothetical protein M4579_002950 [Chaenotheca gracillima]|nr:MAG: hypothetical protein M4579_002950 [Chaenotheca gracillima]